ncbi:MAG: sulfite exporter TauE/SafE family protein [Moraxella sp.]|uniref:sulfite exporter TauE/SafE family protein n=1 Tax=Moraxella sp. TaxID=479 RepID=UPI0026DCE057|nr:sulfite exporter TauE/SafE family protein [Moraxella sp.]MDO4450859.1 sulfite exporter TauE/SafE family protein [Moraxella sp.]
MNFALLIPALAMGFLGSPHCMGMCGGIVAAFGISMKNLNPQKRGILIASYHVGRILSYMGLGLVATLVGETVLAPFITGNALPRIILGLAIIFASLLMLGLPILNRLEKVGLGLWQALAPIRQKVLPMDSIPKALSAGLLWGLLPCGMVYGALVMAVSISATSEPMMGVLFMAMFGLGTIPMLALTGATLSWLQQKVKAFNLRRFSGAIMLISGILVMTHNGGGHHNHHHAHTHDDTTHMTHQHAMSDHANHEHDHSTHHH